MGGRKEREGGVHPGIHPGIRPGTTSTFQSHHTTFTHISHTTPIEGHKKTRTQTKIQIHYSITQTAPLLRHPNHLRKRVPFDSKAWACVDGGARSSQVQAPQIQGKDRTRGGDQLRGASGRGHLPRGRMTPRTIGGRGSPPPSLKRVGARKAGGRRGGNGRDTWTAGGRWTVTDQTSHWPVDGGYSPCPLPPLPPPPHHHPLRLDEG